MKSKKELLFELREVMEANGTLTILHTNAIAQKIGISATEFEAMDIISKHQPIYAGELAKLCGLTTGAITGIVDRLERARLVRRKIDPADRRKVLLEPIEDQRKVRKIRKLYQPMAEGFQKQINEYSVEQIEFLIQAHAQMNRTVKHILEDMQK